MTYRYTNFGVETPLGNTLSVDAQKNQEKSENIARFQQMMDNEESMTLDFTHMDEKGNLDCLVGNFRVVLPASELNVSEETTYSKKLRNLATRYEVLITEINEKKNEITVERKNKSDLNREKVMQSLKFLVRNQQKQLNEIRSQVTEEVERMMKEDLADIAAKMNSKGRARLKHDRINEMTISEMERQGAEKIIVPAKVRKVERDYALLDIMGYGIPGYISRQNWSYGKITSLLNVTKENDVIDVAVLTYSNHILSSKSHGGYICARTPIVDNPWDNLIYKVNDIVKLKCVSMMKSGWFGIIEGCETELYCEYPRTEQLLEECRIIVGEEYECRIYSITPETKSMRARPIRRVTRTIGR